MWRGARNLFADEGIGGKSVAGESIDKNVDKTYDGNDEESTTLKMVRFERLKNVRKITGELPRTGGSILGLLTTVVKSGDSYGLQNGWDCLSRIWLRSLNRNGVKRSNKALWDYFTKQEDRHVEWGPEDGYQSVGISFKESRCEQVRLRWKNGSKGLKNHSNVAVWKRDEISPNKVKKEFLDHFRNRFCKPGERKATLQMEFPKQIHPDQQRELESEVTNEEIKKAVWECGTDKAPGPDGFTFGFFRHFWYLVEREVYDAVREKKQTLIFKVDFEKAYDSVRWDFLDDVLSKFGFGDKWRKWIQCCLHSSRGSIIINGSPTEEFQFGKGLKQGDPLSPFLFILIMESLHLSVQRVVDEGMFHGINLGGVVNLSHMFYADDAVFVGQWSESNISTLVHVLECFHRVSGLKINMSKSKIMGIHVDNVNVSRAANKLGCLVLKTPFLYLGSFVGRAMHQLQAWNDIVDRVRRRLSKWKIKMLSIG
ncbi:RNA-directed DNA polymerase, eukaryota [Tanacetum coccineum]